MTQPFMGACERLSPDLRHELPDPGRAPPERLRGEIDAVARSPVVTALLEAVDAILLVLNPERQVVAFNSRVPRVRTPDALLGSRPGDLLACVNAGAEGCGRSPTCTTCGALGAILASRSRGRPVEAECLIRTEEGGAGALELNVRATPVAIEGGTYTIVSLRDISAEKRREALEQVFFHDVLNTVAGLRGWAQRLQRPPVDVERASRRIDFLTHEIEREIRDHQALLMAESGTLVTGPAHLRVREVLGDVAAVFSDHPASRDRRLEVAGAADELELVTDRGLLVRVLVNMVRNALEAVPPGAAVRLGAAAEPGGRVRLEVHNPGVIPPAVRLRIFQRSFSTKAARGRGLGTYSMKLFGERYLGGEVGFETSEAAGTTFWIRLPAPPM